MSTSTANYRRPGRVTRRLLNPAVAGLTRAGVSVWGSRILETNGRRSGLPRRTPVNLLLVDGNRYLVSPRGESDWVRNIRSDGGRLVLIVGRQREALVARELVDGDKPPILRAYLRRWKMEVGAFFEGVTADSNEADLTRIAPHHPVFVLTDPTI